MNLPALEVHDRQRTVKVPILRLRSLAAASLPGLLAATGPGDVVLPALVRVEISLVSDRVIGRIHRQFLGIPGPTDVITFPHGEIVIGISEVRRNAVRFRQPLLSEALRVVLHGLLHLNGHRDEADAEREAMHAVQERLVAGALA